MFVSVPLCDDAFKARHLTVVRTDCADVSPKIFFPWKVIFETNRFFLEEKKYYLLVFLCSFLWGRQFALCPTCSKLYFFTKKHKVHFSSYIWYRLYLHLKPLVDFLAMGGEELLEIAFFRFSFFRRRVPPIESSLKGDIIIVIEKQILQAISILRQLSCLVLILIDPGAPGCHLTWTTCRCRSWEHCWASSCAGSPRLPRTSTTFFAPPAVSLSLSPSTPSHPGPDWFYSQTINR